MPKFYWKVSFFTLLYQHFQASCFLCPEPFCLKKYPFKELIVSAILIYKINADTEQIQWHQRLGYPCDEYLYLAYKFLDVVPNSKKRSNVISCCSTCIQAKQTKTAPRYNSICRVIHMGQGLSIDFSFSGVMSKSKERCEYYVGINGETCWILVTNHFTSMQFGATRQSKISPTQ